ncbi:OmpA family protein [Roseovarius amoyensis]|uniref:OmpA family protein n=1 Tax=Roseovarius amoyensis TaxID=2211448 RepID=UPI001EF9AFD1|nr:OmpA family protein [Roseovarius amoyensis]
MSGGLRALCLPVAVLAAFAVPVRALELNLPGEAELTREEMQPADTYFLPVGPFADGVLPVQEIEGQITRQAWRIVNGEVTTLQLIAPLREQLAAAGYDIVFDCVADQCGGFDFRFSTEVLPAPDMLVDLFDFRFLAAQRRNGNGAEFISCLVSVSGGAGYVQLVAAGAQTVPVVAATPVAPPPPGVPASAVVAQLVSQGHVVLGDLDFASGAAALGQGPYVSLSALAAYLAGGDTRRIALVGHTDAVGGLDTNMALSRERASAVLERLVQTYGADRAQMEAHGAGYLAPVAPNTTPAGREANRRVEAVLLSGGGG